MKHTQPQKQRLLALFSAGKSITTLEAMQKFRICRLSERIRELKKEGHSIETERVVRNGATFARYKLAA